MNVDKEGEPEGTLGEIQMDLPPGLIGNPLATPRCPLADLQGSVPQCGGATQVGILHGIVTDIGLISTPVYNLEPLPGYAATFGISVQGETYLQRLRLTGAGASSALRFSMALPSEPAIVDLEEEIWGVPADPAHDPERFCLDSEGKGFEGCSSEAEERPFLTLPANCDEPLRTTLTAVSAAERPETAVATAVSRDAGGNPRPLAGCDSVPFAPDFSLRTGPAASLPTALSLSLGVSQNEGEQAAAALAAVDVDLPPGLSLNPAAGSWLSGSSWLGSVKLRTTAIDHDLSGSIYLAEPGPAPFAGHVGIALVVVDERPGVSLRIPGTLVADTVDGRLTAKFSDLPQIPIEELDLEFAGGPRSALAAPSDCGEYTAEATLTPSTAPFAPTLSRRAPMAVTTGPGGEPCPPPEANRNATPSFQAGTLFPAAGSDSPLVIQLSREDTDQRFGFFDLTLPPGLVADLGSVPLGSRVGSVQVKAGVGPEPLALEGDAYLEGPYRGAPYSLAIVVPAKVGPFDLGTITERMAVDVDPATAQIGVRADPLPQILGGVPLALRDLRIDLDRSGFIRNPTSCGSMAIAGSATSATGQSAPLSAPFRIANCGGLPFKPRLSVRMLGSTARGAHPGVRAKLHSGAGSAGLKRLNVDLPDSVLLDERRIEAVCAMPAAKTGDCPSGSVVAHLEVDTPLLSEPLAGPVFLRASKGRLPGLTAVLDGAVQLRLSGYLGSAKGRLRVGFSSLPDVPFDALTLRIVGGKRGILVNSGGVCSGAERLTATLRSHSGRSLTAHPRLRARCPAG